MKLSYAINKPAWLIALIMLLVATDALARDLPDFTELVEQYGKTVVNISTTQKIKHPKTSRIKYSIPRIPAC